jgi:hypothetical protein
MSTLPLNLSLKAKRGFCENRSSVRTAPPPSAGPCHAPPQPPDFLGKRAPSLRRRGVDHRDGGYVEDSAERQIEPGTAFDLTVPIWRVGECLLHAAKLGALLAPDRDLRVLFRARWYGLAGRRLISYTGNRMLFGNYICLQDEYGGEATIDVARISESLPEIVAPLVVPLLERFGFFQVPESLAAEELTRMRSHQSSPFEGSTVPGFGRGR